MLRKKQKTKQEKIQGIIVETLLLLTGFATYYETKNIIWTIVAIIVVLLVAYSVIFYLEQRGKVK